jgi:hypothetical protein
MRENAVYRYLARFGQAVSETVRSFLNGPAIDISHSPAPGNPRGGIYDSGITTLGASGGVGRRSGVGRGLGEGVGLGVGVASDTAKAYTLSSPAT